MNRLGILSVAVLGVGVGVLAAAKELQSWSGWTVNDGQRPTPPVVQPAERLGDAPADASVLFDGSSLEAWNAQEVGWFITEDGTMQGRGGNGSRVSTLEAFGDCQLHVEWRIPSREELGTQRGGNSGVFLGGGRYEVQIVPKAPEHTTYADGMAGAVYGQQPPFVEASRALGEWNVFEIFYRAPRFDARGEVVDRGLITVSLNGVCVQHGWAFRGVTTHRVAPRFRAHVPEQPIGLQFHRPHEIVEFRNVWVRELPSYGDDYRRDGA